LAGGVLNALAADPGIGKTVLVMTLTRILWCGQRWPDGAENSYPAGSKTLWVAADNHFTQLLDLASQYGLPDDGILLNAVRSNPTGGLDLDDPAELEGLRERVLAEKPVLVVIDTVNMTTSRNLCRPEDARAYFGPLMVIANETSVPFLLLTHLSKDETPLGRRIVGAARVVWTMTHPDPEAEGDRRRLWVSKSYVAKPEALGVTISDTGCSFDGNPPTKPEPRRPGPAGAKLDECKRWLTDQLKPNPARVTDVRRDAEQAGYKAAILYRAKDSLGVLEYTVGRYKWWRLVPDVQAPISDNSDKPS
jgi:hypothetical protein